MSIASLNLDFYDDSERTGLKKLASSPLPSGLESVPLNVLTSEDLENLENDQFGLVVVTKTASVVRKFPLHDPSHTWLSAKYFEFNHDKLAMPAQIAAAHHIKIAADAYGVPLPMVVEETASLYTDEFNGNTFVEGSEARWNLRHPEVASSMVKVAEQALDDSAYALVYSTGDGETIRKYAMPNQATVRQAADWFEKYAGQIEYQHRPRMAKAIVKRAESLQVALGKPEEYPALSKYAMGGWNANISAHLAQRASFMPRDEKSVQILSKLAQHIGSTDPESFAQALEAFDTKAGLKKYYGRGLEDAYSSSLGTTKTAGGWSGEVEGETITEGDLVKAAQRPSFKAFFGETVKTAFEKDPVTIFESLPIPHQALIAQIARGEA